ncbi:MAG: 50S ribosomal protein L30 [Candidatus Sumerlaeaceae bacterium]|nr:50S ribosomal protein L30 [Candidatus Sumerlaeaceae bacterium]
MAAKKVKITWVKSGINRLKEHRSTLKALGFTHLNQTRLHERTPQIDGMLRQVGYLLNIEEVK